MVDSSILSYHAFLFPFRWERRGEDNLDMFKSASQDMAQRASLINFSKRVTKISRLKGDSSDKILKLHQDFIGFVNKMYFNKVTAQEQGIELYEMMLRLMKMKENVKDAENEINALHNFAELEQNKKINRAINIITFLNLYLFLSTFVAGFFGKNIFNKSWIDWNKQHPATLIVYFVGSL